MPIQIRELVIRATVESAAGEKLRKDETPDRAREELVAECVDQVLEVLRKKAER